jgi:hypothetical protein
MPRKPSFPEVGTLRLVGEQVSFRSFLHPRVVSKTAKQYAARHGFAVVVDAQSEPADVRAESGTLYLVARVS